MYSTYPIISSTKKEYLNLVELAQKYNELKYNNNLLRIIPNKKNHKFIKINTLYC